MQKWMRVFIKQERGNQATDNVAVEFRGHVSVSVSVSVMVR